MNKKDERDGGFGWLVGFFFDDVGIDDLERSHEHDGDDDGHRRSHERSHNEATCLSLRRRVRETTSGHLRCYVADWALEAEGATASLTAGSAGTAVMPQKLSDLGGRACENPLSFKNRSRWRMLTRSAGRRAGTGGAAQQRATEQRTPQTKTKTKTKTIAPPLFKHMIKTVNDLSQVSMREWRRARWAGAGDPRRNCSTAGDEAADTTNQNHRPTNFQTYD